MRPRRKMVFLAGVSAILPIILPSLAVAENGDWTTEYLKTAVTETVDRDIEGDVTGRTVVTDTKIEVRRKVTESSRVDSNGVERVVSRKTESYDSVATRAIPIETVIESIDPSNGLLVATAVTTVTKNPSGQVTTYEARDPKRRSLHITKRITSILNEQGDRVVTIEVPDRNGRLVVTKTTTQSTR
jgi:hypothetical protein